MAAVSEPYRGDPFANNDSPSSFGNPLPKSLPILTSTVMSSDGDEAMDLSQPQPSPSSGRNADSTQQPASTSQASSTNDGATNGAVAQPIGAAAAAAAAATQQPKVVQTAFIHKLYNMLEDSSIEHLIAWSATNDSFVMSPSTDFSKVLSTYFKHTNISSFVRQLNMYGFHKVSDVFHNGAPDSPLWEFKHGAGNFKRGDLVGLREIKRRASRHTLINRDSFSGPPKIATPQPTPQTMPVETMQDPVEARMHTLEWSNHDLMSRLVRLEEVCSNMSNKMQTTLEGLSRSYQWTHEISNQIMHMVPDPANPIHREMSAIRSDIGRNIEQLRSLEEPQSSPFSHRPSFFQSSAHQPHHHENAAPLSPRQRPFDESRRPSLQGLPRTATIRAAVPPHMQLSPRRYGSIGNASGAFSPSSSRVGFAPPPPPPPPPPAAPSAAPPVHTQHPLATMSSPPQFSQGRRHTSADIRVHNWEGGNQPNASPYASGQSSTNWPSSPRAVPNHGDQQLRDSLASYELPRMNANLPTSRAHSPGPHDPVAPPVFTNSFASSNTTSSTATTTGGTSLSSYANSNDTGWSLPPRFSHRSGGLEAPPGPPTRRSSMASNVHSLLNPADTAEREGEDEGSADGPEERKRKRLG